MKTSRRYSQHASRAMMNARILAADFKHGFVDTGHLMVGVLQAEGSIGSRVLLDLEVSLQTCQERVRTRYAVLDSMPNPTLPLSSALRETVKVAFEEARLLGQHYVGTEHFLLALARDYQSSLPDLLSDLDLTADQIRRQVRRVIQTGSTEMGQEANKRLARLSELSQRVINRANQLAEEMGQPQGNLAHLLLALAQEKRSPVSRVLGTSSLNMSTLLQEAEFRRFNGAFAVESVLDEAVLLAERMGSHYTGTDHIILAFTRDLHGRELLRQCGLPPDELAARLPQV